jgi:hypothetical protein
VILQHQFSGQVRPLAALSRQSEAPLVEVPLASRFNSIFVVAKPEEPHSKQTVLLIQAPAWLKEHGIESPA